MQSLRRRPARTMTAKHERHRQNLFLAATVLLRLLAVPAVIILLQCTDLSILVRSLLMSIGSTAFMVWAWRHIKSETLSMRAAGSPAQEKNEWRRYLDREISARREIRWQEASIFVLGPLFLVDVQVPATVLAAITLSLSFALLVGWSRFYALPRLVNSRKALL